MEARISRALLERLLAEAAASPGREVCGLLFGHSLLAQHERFLSVDTARSTANVSPHPADSFEIDPAALFAALRAERAGDARIIGHYHSHPRGAARPSPRDAAAAEAGRLWLILGAGEATAWLAVPGGSVEGAFEPVTLEITGEAGCAP